MFVLVPIVFMIFFLRVNIVQQMEKMPVMRQNFVNKGNIYTAEAGASLGDLHMNSCHRQDRKFGTYCRTASRCIQHFDTSSVHRFSRLDPTRCFFALLVSLSLYSGQCCIETSLGTNFPQLGMISILGPPGLHEIMQTDV